MINLNLDDSSISDVKYGSHQVDKVYHSSDLVWQRDKWVEYVFPNDDAFVSSEENYGFEVNLKLNSNTNEISYNLLFGLNNNKTNAPKIVNTHEDWSHVYKIKLPSQFQNAIFCHIDVYKTTAKRNIVKAGVDENSLTQYCTLQPSADYLQTSINNSASSPDFSASNCGLIYITTYASDTSYYTGSYFLKFKIRQSDLQAWKNQYNVS